MRRLVDSGELAAEAASPVRKPMFLVWLIA
jgi:hypothetical protein